MAAVTTWQWQAVSPGHVSCSAGSALRSPKPHALCSCSSAENFWGKENFPPPKTGTTMLW